MLSKLNGCKCCRVGTYRCLRNVIYPLSGNRIISVDRCLAPELESLWLRGIETTGCCCGHGDRDGFIQVAAEYVGDMYALGYDYIPPVEVDGQLMGENAFKPKTEFEFGGYDETKTVLEERYEGLVKLVEDSASKLDEIDGGYQTASLACYMRRRMREVSERG